MSSFVGDYPSTQVLAQLRAEAELVFDDVDDRAAWVADALPEDRLRSAVKELLAAQEGVFGSLLIQLETITPSQAEALLRETNHRNRNLNTSTILSYARDIAAGRWTLTGDALRFDQDGVLLDGQHRLAAIVRADRAIKTLVIRNLATSTQDNMDMHRKRQIADVLRIKGQPHPHSLAGAVKIGIAIDAAVTVASTRPTEGETDEWIAAHPRIIDAVKLSQSLYRGIGVIRPSVITYCVWATSEANSQASAEFWTAMAENATEGLGDPRNALLNRMRLMSREKAVDSSVQVSMVFRAWNAWRRGQRQERLQSITRSGKVVVPDLVK